MACLCSGTIILGSSSHMYININRDQVRKSPRPAHLRKLSQKDVCEGKRQEGGTECLEASVLSLMMGLVNNFRDDAVPNPANAV